MPVDDCDAIRVLDAILLCMTIFSAIAALLTLAGSIIGCVGVCGGNRQQVRLALLLQLLFIAYNNYIEDIIQTISQNAV